mmetsp:Transcript_1273/g.1819  ORF Transcript_1273/g.1819 Transcript_1273/m.1819 type:complete len:270 (+) Transcript_1273:48-857(+)
MSSGQVFNSLHCNKNSQSTGFEQRNINADPCGDCGMVGTIDNNAEACLFCETPPGNPTNISVSNSTITSITPSTSGKSSCLTDDSSIRIDDKVYSIVDYSNGVYEGEFRDGKRDGRGIMRWRSGAEYDGEFCDDIMRGHGTYRFKNGEMYEGEFVNDNVVGGLGIYWHNSGNVYKGEWQNNKKEGRGVLIKDGVVIFHLYVNGKPEGHGVQIDQNRAHVRARRQKAYLLLKGQMMNEIAIEKAKEIVTNLGFFNSDFQELVPKVFYVLS